MAPWKLEIAVIVAREFLEASVIIGQYRKVVFGQQWKEDVTNTFLKTIWLAAAAAAGLAATMILALGVGLNAAGQDLNDATVETIEGISKIVAAICIAGLSLQIPKWLNVYPSKNKDKKIGVTRTELCFNVAWNIWREMAEIGAFLIPFFLDNEGLEAIPLSAFIGLLIGLLAGAAIYAATYLMKDLGSLAFFLAFVTGWLSTGLFTGGCHEIEEVAGETEKAWKIEADFWSNKKFPMVVLKPFGWAQSPTVLWLLCFFAWEHLLVVAHVINRQMAYRQAAGQVDGKVEEPSSGGIKVENAAPYSGAPQEEI